MQSSRHLGWGELKSPFTAGRAGIAKESSTGANRVKVSRKMNIRGGREACGLELVRSRELSEPEVAFSKKDPRKSAHKGQRDCGQRSQ